MNEQQAAIITRLEAPIGADQGLSIDIAFAIGWRVSWGEWYSPATAAEARNSKKALSAYPVSSEPPDFTGSLDAAVSLVPDGYFYALTTHEDHACASCDKKSGRWDWESAATAPLALCLAALKARWS